MTVGTFNRGDTSYLDPRELPGLEAWYDSAFLSGIGVSNPADATPISQCNDISGKNRHAIQATTSKKPLFRNANINLLALAIAQCTSGWGNQGGGTVTLGNTDHPEHGNAFKVVVPGVASFEGSIQTTAGIQLTTGIQYTVSQWIYSTVARNYRMEVFNQNTFAGTHVDSGIAHPGGGWARLSYSFVCSTTGTYGMVVDTGASNPIQALTFYVAQGQVEIGIVATVWIPPGNIQGMQFDGVSTELASVIPVLTSSTVYAVFQNEPINTAIPPPNPYHPYGMVWAVGRLNSSWNNFFLQNSGLTPTQAVAPYNNSAGIQTTPRFAQPVYDGVSHIVASSMDPSNLLITAQLDGRVPISSTWLSRDGVPLPTDFHMGNTPIDGGYGALKGIISDLLVFSTTHDLATSRRVNRMLAQNKGVVLVP